ncbi:MAG: penicillin acylase family protein [Hyphomicrobiaceae bacterium]|nr:penicillin acylase family protein [Hyphomicrobiaceae bacterium]
MRRTRAWVKRSLAVAGLVLVGAAVAGVVVLGGTVPPLTGTLALPGLASPVSIVRDGNAVPHIFGSSVADLYRALGFAHAQDRLWQMEMLRRAGQGRLSEIFGERTLEADIFLRTLDLDGHAERGFQSFPGEAQRLLEAYAAGVNAFVSRQTGLMEQRLPPEFLLLGHAPEPWRPADSVTVVKVMALNLSANLGAEIQRLTLAAQGLSPAEIEDLMPLNGGERPPPLPDLAQLYPLRRLDAPTPREQTAALDELFGAGASNSWVIAGSRTASGKPLLANDPHLRLTAPSVWYLAHLALGDPQRGGVNVVGASLPGTPIIVLGRGDTLAWGFTNAEADVQDLFIERINPGNPAEYLTPAGWRPFESTSMEIRVAGGRTRMVERRRTRHGPVLPGSFRNLAKILAPGHVAALQWTALTDDDTTITAGLLDASLRTVPAYLERARLYMVPMQSVVVADSQGRIAMIAPGRLPMRSPANTIAGRAPVPGWDATFDWQGFVPFEALPRVVSPPEAAIGTANARIVGDGYPHLVTHDWEADYRARRIQDLVTSRTGHDMETMRAAQLDVFSPAFAELAPLMIAAARPLVSVDKDVLDRLSRWDATMRADAPEPLVFVAWLREAVRAIYADDLGPAFDLFFHPRAKSMTRLLRGETTGRDWCDERPTAARESCGEALAAALRRAIQGLEERFGRDRMRWSWGSAHAALGENQVLGELPLVGRLFNIGTASPGGPYTLNRGVMEFGRDDPFANRHASTFRAIYDLGDLDRSLFMQSTGQSGNPFSRHYRTFEKSWAEGRYIRIPTDRAAIEREAIGTWRLVQPAEGAG